MVPVGSAGPEFHVNFGSGRVGLGHKIFRLGWVGLSRVGSNIKNI